MRCDHTSAFHDGARLLGEAGDYAVDPALGTDPRESAWLSVARAVAALVLSDSRSGADRADQAKAIRLLRRGVVALLEGHPLLADGDASGGDVGADTWLVLLLVDALRDEFERRELSNRSTNGDVARLL